MAKLLLATDTQTPPPTPPKKKVTLPKHSDKETVRICQRKALYVNLFNLNFFS